MESRRGRALQEGEGGRRGAGCRAEDTEEEEGGALQEGAGGRRGAGACLGQWGQVGGVPEADCVFT